MKNLLSGIIFIVLWTLFAFIINGLIENKLYAMLVFGGIVVILSTILDILEKR